jgi:hypothetical protein
MTRQTLVEAKGIALQSLSHEWIHSAFATHLAETYGIPRECVMFDYEAAAQRVKDAILLSPAESKARQDEINGETDGETIWITRGLSLDDCVETLLHEAMHDSVFLKRNTRSGERKGLSCEVEHDVIYQLLP